MSGFDVLIDELKARVARLENMLLTTRRWQRREARWELKWAIRCQQRVESIQTRGATIYEALKAAQTPRELTQLIQDYSEPDCFYWPSLGSHGNHVKVWRWCIDPLGRDAIEQHQKADAPLTGITLEQCGVTFHPECVAVARLRRDANNPLRLTALARDGVNGSFYMLGCGVHRRDEMNLIHFNCRSYTLSTASVQSPSQQIMFEKLGAMAVFQERTDHGAPCRKQTSQTLYLCGGEAAGLNEMREMWKLPIDFCDSKQMRAWTRCADMPRRLTNHAAVQLRDMICVAGGIIRCPDNPNTASHQKTGEVWAYSPAKDTWYPLPPLLIKRASHMMAVLDDRVIVFGGNEGSIEVLQIPDHIGHKSSSSLVGETNSSDWRSHVRFMQIPQDSWDFRQSKPSVHQVNGSTLFCSSTHEVVWTNYDDRGMLRTTPHDPLPLIVRIDSSSMPSTAHFEALSEFQQNESRSKILESCACFCQS